VQPAQCRAGLDAELLDEPPPGRVECRQGVGLSSGAVERAHLQLHEALVERVGGHERFELSEQLAMAAELEVELDPLDHRAEALLLEPAALGAEETVVAGAAQRPAPPQAEGRFDLRPGDERIARLARAPGIRERIVPAVDVAPADRHVERVAASPADQSAGVAPGCGERLAQARDVHLQAVAGARRRVVAPELIDQIGVGDDMTGGDREHGEERPRPLASECHRPAVDPRLDRAEQLDP
jgi:hypothetical protein